MQIYRKPPQVLPIESAFFKLPDTLLMVLDNTWTIQMISEAWKDALGLEPRDLRWRSFLDFVHRTDREDVIKRLTGITEERSTIRFSCRCCRRDGRFLGLAWSVSYDPSEGLFYASAHETAVSLNNTEASLPDVFVDGLTGLPNRSLFLDRVQHALQRAHRREELQFAVLYCGIDRFKVVNHSLGNRVGDLLLIEIANIIRRSIRPTDMVARLGGDEFGVLLEEVRDASSPVRVVRRIQEKFVVPFQLYEHEVFSTLSSGIAVIGEQYTAADQMIRDASMAMMKAKEQGGGSYVMFNRQMHDAAVRRLELELDLRRAVEKNQFEAYYQPIMEMKTGRLSGFEALVRWNHPTKGLISPAEFIPLAEETGLIVQIGRWMLEESCRQLAFWHAQFPSHMALTVSVNLSARQLHQAQLTEDIHRILRETPLPASCLKLEITESAMMEDADKAITVLTGLRKTGLKLLLDDFGTGYSSLSYLHRLPIDTLKVDRSFVMHMHESQADRGFVETIVNLAHQLGRDVICEGIELIEQARIIQQIGVSYGQGYLYSRPVSALQAEMLIVEDMQKGKTQTGPA
jgi:diguanylate cyclase (GGDEF)-like protein